MFKEIQVQQVLRVLRALEEKLDLQALQARLVLRALEEKQE